MKERQTDRVVPVTSMEMERGFFFFFFFYFVSFRVLLVEGADVEGVRCIDLPPRRDQWRGVLLHVNLGPIHALEEGVLLHLVRPATELESGNEINSSPAHKKKAPNIPSAAAAQPLIHVAMEQSFQQIPEFRGEVVREFHVLQW